MILPGIQTNQSTLVQSLCNFLLKERGPAPRPALTHVFLLHFFILAHEYRACNVVHFGITDIPDKDDLRVHAQELHHFAWRWEVHQARRLLITGQSINLARLVADHQSPVLGMDKLYGST